MQNQDLLTKKYIKNDRIGGGLLMVIFQYND